MSSPCSYVSVVFLRKYIVEQSPFSVLARCGGKQIQYRIWRSTSVETRSGVCETVAEIHSCIAFEEFVVAMCLGVSARVCWWTAVRLCVLTPQSESRLQMSRVCWRRRSPSSYCAVPSGPSALQARWTARGSCSWSCPRSSGPLGLTCPWWRRKERKTAV